MRQATGREAEQGASEEEQGEIERGKQGSRKAGKQEEIGRAKQGTERSWRERPSSRIEAVRKQRERGEGGREAGRDGERESRK